MRTALSIKRAWKGGPPDAYTWRREQIQLPKQYVVSVMLDDGQGRPTE